MQIDNLSSDFKNQELWGFNYTIVDKYAKQIL